MNDTILKRAAQCYSVAESPLAPLSGGHVSHVYGFAKDGRDYVLRITPPNDEIDLGAMRAILTWMRYLADHGASVSKPILSQNDLLIEQILEGDEAYIVTALEKAPGVLGEELPFEEWTPARIERLGQTVGKLHAVAKSYTPPKAALTRPQWDEVGNCFHPLEQLPSSEALIAQKAQDVLAYIQTLPKDSDSYGMVHADLHGGNFFVDTVTNTITVFDFDDCSYGWFVMDIAMALFDVLVLYSGEDKIAFAEQFMHDYLRGYALENQISKFWLSQLLHFLKLLEIGIYTQVFSFYDPNDTTSWVGRFMANRKYRIEHDIPYIDLDLTS